MPNIMHDMKILLLNKQTTMTELLRLLSEKYDRSEALPNFHRKLSNETIKFKEILEIADVLGYNIAWVPKELKLEAGKGIHISSHSYPTNKDIANSNFLVAESSPIYEDEDNKPPR